MNIESMRIKSYRSFKVAEHVPAAAAQRYRTLKAYDRLRAAGCNEAVALEQLGIGRRTRYRWQAALAAGGQHALAPRSTRPRRVRRRFWTPKDVKAVLGLRRKYPFMGKARIQAMLARKGGRLSVSTVGRPSLPTSLRHRVPLELVRAAEVNSDESRQRAHDVDGR